MPVARMSTVAATFYLLALFLKHIQHGSKFCGVERDAGGPVSRFRKDGG